MIRHRKAHSIWYLVSGIWYLVALRHAFLFLFNFFCWFFGSVNTREACFGPCVVAAAYAAVVNSATYTGM